MDKGKKTGADKTKLGAIFDMDGVIADSIPYHILAWIEFAKRYGFKVTKQIVLEHFNGRVNSEILQYIFNNKLPPSEVKLYSKEKELLFRKIYKQKVKPLRGLIKFLKLLKLANVKVVLATAGPPENVALILNGSGTKKYFSKVINSSHVKLGKPNPEIFLKAAKLINVAPKNCIVFEDALSGIKAARAAGMKAVGITTSHKTGELKYSDLVIKDFFGLTLEKLEKLIQLGY